MSINHKKPFFCLGSSMNPTLRSGDLLIVKPYKDNKIQLGDVIVFHKSGIDYVTHRVVRIEGNRIKTCGDNSVEFDSWTLHPNDIVGKVVATERKKRKIAINHGLSGYLDFTLKRAICRFKKSTLTILRYIYQLFLKKSIAKIDLIRWLKPNVVTFQRRGGTEYQLIFRSHTIGRLLPGQTEWQIRTPFKQFIDESKLPQNASRLVFDRKPQEQELDV